MFFYVTSGGPLAVSEGFGLGVRTCGRGFRGGRVSRGGVIRML